MQSIYVKTAGQAWIAAINEVMLEGNYLNKTDIYVQEVIDLFVEVEDGQSFDDILNKHADLKMIDWMVNNNFGGTKPVLNWGYCYGMRLYDFNGVNQITKVVEKLRSNSEVRSATINFIKPEDDFDGHMPCITTLDIKIRNSKLYITGFFRSQDVGKKLYADILAIGSIQKNIADQVGVECGSVKIFISSAHIYETEFDEVKKIVTSITNDKSKVQ